jgi:hypothetical protein
LELFILINNLNFIKVTIKSFTFSGQSSLEGAFQFYILIFDHVFIEKRPLFPLFKLIAFADYFWNLNFPKLVKFPIFIYWALPAEGIF